MQYFFTIFILITSIACTCAQATLEGQVMEAETKEPVLFGNVALYQDGILVTGVETDFDGFYTIKNIKAGEYTVEASYVGLKKKRIEKVVLLDKSITALDIELEEGIERIYCGGCCYFFDHPLYEQDNMTSGQIWTSDEIRNSGHRF